jgi:hypothetical protein
LVWKHSNLFRCTRLYQDLRLISLKPLALSCEHGYAASLHLEVELVQFIENITEECQLL